MNANELADEVEMWGKDLLALNMKGGIPVIEGAKLLRQQQSEIEKLRSWVEMLVEIPFFNEIDHYRGIPVAILRKAQK